MNVETILRNKGNWVATIRPDATVANAVDLLHRERIGAIVVSEDGIAVDGILSERDVVIALAEDGADLLAPAWFITSHSALPTTRSNRHGVECWSPPDPTFHP